MNADKGITVMIVVCASLCAAQSQPSVSPYPAANFTTIIGPWDAAGVGTYPLFINEKGDILGYYQISSGFPHGFVQLHECNTADERTDDRECGMTFTLDAPNAEGTLPIGADRNGTILGSWSDASGTHGALWWPQCTDSGCTLNFESFDAHGAATQGSSPTRMTLPTAIGAGGAIVGTYFDNSGGEYAFYATQERIPDDPSSPITLNFSEVTVPGYSATYGGSVNSKGEMDGGACNISVCLIFLRSPRGIVTTPGPQTPGNIIPGAINSSGEVVGWENNQYFLYQQDGNVTLLDFQPEAINKRGLIAGNKTIEEAGGLMYEITLRASDGTEVSFSPPGQPNVFVTGMNNKGWIVGSYEDGFNPTKGFVWKP